MVTVACGRCVGCRLEKSRQWAIRCVHEASLHEENCFITLTYNDSHLPPSGGLNKKHFQDFMKRYRKKFPSRRIRYFHCGEYGEENGRPHYHAIIFNHDFFDKRMYSVRDGVTLWTSDTLTELWGKGFCTIGAVTFESAAYVARYVMKKVTGDRAVARYGVIDPDTGELKLDKDGEPVMIQPEYVTMSRGRDGTKGIGYEWYRKFKDDVYPEDEIIIRGRKMKPPRYYDGLYEEDEKAYRKLKSERMRKSKKDAANQTAERLAVRETVKKAQLKSLKRSV